ncbi:MAG: histidine phosphatase family protein [Methylobacteriaceae bacterium]|nr:histidine phosphatase family protein [Methylobacteriaceae bacterium]MBV9220162.1 histidine phosphatase family protein [Methylobacteriaceae bacterium]MBV9635722.1 histidine phosphatase family protein [Methylobacteriaceae bacterium]MBV9704619.1 histidine phosphatase family protein [Methylobacteriaceae bacterium]
MRRLVLFRHAKADPRNHGTSLDHERTLTRRGRDDAPRIGRYLANADIVPDLALVSDSVRTKETFDLAQEAFGRPIPLRLEPAMYKADVPGLLQMVRKTNDTLATLLLVGHNPEFAELAVELTGQGEPDLLTQMRTKFPTAAVAVIDFDGDQWIEVGPRKGRLDAFVTPAALGASHDE